MATFAVPDIIDMAWVSWFHEHLRASIEAELPLEVGPNLCNACLMSPRRSSSLVRPLHVANATRIVMCARAPAIFLRNSSYSNVGVRMQDALPEHCASVILGRLATILERESTVLEVRCVCESLQR
jgi:hypothetical protein